MYKINLGKESVYAYSDLERDHHVSRIKGGKKTEVVSTAEEGNGAAGETPSRVSISIQRYKGLGEMNPEQLWETTKNPEHRILKRVNNKDAAETDEVFNMLMGEAVPPRKKFIQGHAVSANLDI